jgi:polyisoprenoid-binding protein YceI
MTVSTTTKNKSGTEQSKTAKAIAWALDPAHTTVGFSARHMMFTTVRGRFNDVKGEVTIHAERPASSELEVVIDAASIDTGVEQRDQHLRSGDFLNVEDFPTIAFRSRRLEGARLREGERFRIVGELTIRDVTREVTLDVRFDGSGRDPWGGQRMGFTASAVIDRRAFGLTWNQALETGGVLVSNEVKIELEVQLKEEAERQAA